METVLAGVTEQLAARDHIGGAAAPRVGRVEVFDRLRDAEPVWRLLQDAVPASPYQSFAWADAWCSSDASFGLTPAIVVARDHVGTPLALLPLGVSRRYGLRIGRFLGGKDSNCNLGLLSLDVAWCQDEIEALVQSIARTLRLDLLVLDNQPIAWAGRSNPFLHIGARPSPSGSRSTTLPSDPDAYFAAMLSKHARKLLRQKDAKLRALGAVEYRRAETPDDIDAMLDSYFRFKSARFATLGIEPGPSPAAFRSFLQRACVLDGATPSPVELHALLGGDRMVAVFGGTGFGTHFSGMVVAFDADPEIARCSPGDLLIAAVIRDLCRRGFRSFDLGIGEARYKETFCGDLDPRFDSFVGVSLAGRVAAGVAGSIARIKRAIKQSPWAWTLVQKGRRLRAGARHLTRS